MENFFPVEVKEEAEKCDVIECDAACLPVTIWPPSILFCEA